MDDPDEGPVESPDLSVPALDFDAALNLKPEQVRRIALRHGIRLNPRGSARRLETPLSREVYGTLCRLAGSAGLKPSAMLARIVAMPLEGGVEAAARRLGKAARPKRAYQRRLEG